MHFSHILSVSSRLRESSASGDTITVWEILETDIGLEVINDGGQLGDPPLHRACRNGHYNVVKQLLEYGVDIESRDFSQRTALQVQ